MKKMMLLAGLLVLGTMGYAVGTSGDTATATFEAKVNVVSKVEVKAENIDFGDVAQGTTANEKTKGKVAITGAVGKNVKVEFLKGDSAWDGNFNFNQEGLSASAKVDTWDNIYSKTIKLEEGENILTLSGSVTVGDTVPAQEYNSDAITVKVTYDDLNK